MAGTLCKQPTIGAELRSIRVAQGFSLSEMSAKTRLQVPYLQAIEEMRSEDLPSIGYVLGFIRTYATTLGQDGDAAVTRYKSDISAPKHIGMRNRAIFVSKRKVKLPRGLISASTVLVLATGAAVWYASHTRTSAETLRVATAKQDESFRAETTAVTDPNILTVKANAPSWVQAKNDSGKILMSRIMVTGEVWRTERSANISFSARDGGALDVYRGDINLGPLAPKGVAVSDIALSQIPDMFQVEMNPRVRTQNDRIVKTGSNVSSPNAPSLQSPN